MRNIVEPRVRRLVAEHLGVAEDDLSPELSLVEDLAADSLDLAELALAVEDELDVLISEAVLGGVRTYGELVDVLLGLVRARFETEAPGVSVLARVCRSADGAAPTLERAGPLTPYLAETLADDVLRSGPGTRMEVLVAGPAQEQALRHVWNTFAWLGDRGVQVLVQRERHGTRLHHSSAA